MTKPWATIQQIDSTASMAQKGVTEPLFSMAGLFFLFVQCLCGNQPVGQGILRITADGDNVAWMAWGA